MCIRDSYLSIYAPSSTGRPGPVRTRPPSNCPWGTSMAVDRDDLVATLARLVQINSVNPTLVPGAPGEREIAAYVGGWLGTAGLVVTTLESTPGRPSIVARLPGTGRGRSLMLNAHIDTVDVAGMPEP